MPKAKPNNKIETKIPEKKKGKPADVIKVDDTDPEIKDGDLELIPGSESEEDPEDDALMDEDEVDPFKDKWEE